MFRISHGGYIVITDRTVSLEIRYESVCLNVPETNVDIWRAEGLIQVEYVYSTAHAFSCLFCLGAMPKSMSLVLSTQRIKTNGPRLCHGFVFRSIIYSFLLYVEY